MNDLGLFLKNSFSGPKSLAKVASDDVRKKCADILAQHGIDIKTITHFLEQTAFNAEKNMRDAFTLGSSISKREGVAFLKQTTMHVNSMLNYPNYLREILSRADKPAAKPDETEVKPQPNKLPAAEPAKIPENHAPAGMVPINLSNIGNPVVNTGPTNVYVDLGDKLDKLADRLEKIIENGNKVYHIHHYHICDCQHVGGSLSAPHIVDSLINLGIGRSSNTDGTETPSGEDISPLSLNDTIHSNIIASNNTDTDSEVLNSEVSDQSNGTDEAVVTPLTFDTENITHISQTINNDDNVHLDDPLDTMNAEDSIRPHQLTDTNRDNKSFLELAPASASTIDGDTFADMGSLGREQTELQGILDSLGSEDIIEESTLWQQVFPDKQTELLDNEQSLDTPNVTDHLQAPQFLNNTDSTDGAVTRITSDNTESRNQDIKNLFSSSGRTENNSFANIFESGGTDKSQNFAKFTNTINQPASNTVTGDGLVLNEPTRSVRSSVNSFSNKTQPSLAANTINESVRPMPHIDTFMAKAERAGREVTLSAQGLLRPNIVGNDLSAFTRRSKQANDNLNQLATSPLPNSQDIVSSGDKEAPNFITNSSLTLRQRNRDLGFENSSTVRQQQGKSSISAQDKIFPFGAENDTSTVMSNNVGITSNDVIGANSALRSTPDVDNTVGGVQTYISQLDLTVMEDGQIVADESLPSVSAIKSKVDLATMISDQQKTSDVRKTRPYSPYLDENGKQKSPVTLTVDGLHRPR